MHFCHPPLPTFHSSPPTSTHIRLPPLTSYSSSLTSTYLPLVSTLLKGAKIKPILLKLVLNNGKPCELT